MPNSQFTGPFIYYDNPFYNTDLQKNMIIKYASRHKRAIGVEHGLFTLEISTKITEIDEGDRCILLLKGGFKILKFK